MDFLTSVGLLPGCGNPISFFHPAQVLEFAGGILTLLDKAKTTLELLAAEATSEGNVNRSGLLLFPSNLQESPELILESTSSTDLTTGAALKVHSSCPTQVLNHLLLQRNTDRLPEDLPASLSVIYPADSLQWIDFSQTLNLLLHLGESKPDN